MSCTINMLTISAHRWSLFDCLQVTKEEEGESGGSQHSRPPHHSPGFSFNSAGLPGDHAGLPVDHAGLPGDHAGDLKPHKTFLLMVSCVHLHLATAGSLVLL